MNQCEESYYYYCWYNCGLCDGYGWLDPEPPNGCLVFQDTEKDDDKQSKK